MNNVTTVRHADGAVLGDQHRSIGQLQYRAAQAAAGFAAMGVRRGDAVALMLRNDFPFLEATLGLGRLGAYPVPINWHLQSEEVAYILKDSGAKALLVHADLYNRVREGVPRSMRVIVAPVPLAITQAFGLTATQRSVHPLTTLWDDWVDSFQPTTAPPTASAPASLIYTSGTTGKPKGVRRDPPTPEQLKGMEAMRKVVFGAEKGMRALLPGPLYHTANNGFGMTVLRHNGLLVMQPRFEAVGALENIAKHGLTHTMMVPTMFVRLLRLPQRVKARHDLSSLNFVVHMGAPCAPDIKRRMIDWLGPIVHEFYGSTESSAALFCTAQEWLDHPGTVGKPVAGAEVRVIDYDGQDCEPGQIGEIYTRLSFLPEFTYKDRDEDRAEIEHEGLITSGDMGYLDDEGYLFLCDRKKDMIITGGVNIYPAEIENVLITMPGVDDCAVFGIPSEEYGESIMAAVQPSLSCNFDEEDVRDWLRERIASQKVPHQVVFMESLPREDSGKIMKRKLRDPYWSHRERLI